MHKFADASHRPPPNNMTVISAADTSIPQPYSVRVVVTHILVYTTQKSDVMHCHTSHFSRN
jgi:hypothetical protein